MVSNMLRAACLVLAALSALRTWAKDTNDPAANPPADFEMLLRKEQP